MIDPVIKRMLARFRLAADAEADNRKRGLEALKFRRGGEYQWQEEVLELRKGENKPNESYNQIPQFIHQVGNDMRMNMPQIRFVPGTDGSKEEAEVREDLVRNIQASSEAEVAFDIATDSQLTNGWGWFRILTAYDSSDSFDQNIEFGQVPNPFTVYDDPHCLKQSRLDRKWLIQVCDMEVNDFNSEYDRKYDSSDLSSIGDNQPDWASTDGEGGTVRVAEYWEVKETRSKLYRNKDSGKTTKTKPKGEYDEREVVESKVIWRKCTATEVLEERDWMGQYIPYVFVSGEQLNIDGKVYLFGLVEAMMSAQRQFNYWSNTATELAALAPKSPFMAAIDQIKDPAIMSIWANLNNAPTPVLPYKHIDGVPMPQRVSNSADISAAVALVQQAQQNFYNTTGIYPASLGQASNEKSGKAIIARQKEGDVATFHFSDNFARALRCAGVIVDDLIGKVYDGAREIRGLKEDKSSKMVKINQRFTDHNDESQEFDMTKGKYDVMVTTGPSFTTRRQESADAMITLAQSTNLMEVAPDIVYASQDWPGADKIAERYKKTLPPQLTQDDDPKNQVPPQVQAQLQQMQQIIEQGAAQIQQLEQQLQSAQADNSAKMADVQNKQGDLQLKGQQMQLSAEESARKDALDQQRLELDAQKLQLDAEKVDLDKMKLKLEAVKLQSGVENMPKNTGVDTSNGNSSQPMVDMNDKNALQARIQTLMEMDEQKLVSNDAQSLAAEMEAQNRQAELEIDAHRLSLEEQKASEEAMGRQMMLQTLMGVADKLDTLSATIAAPASVIRGENGLIESVVRG